MPRRRNTRLEAEPNPFQAHRTGGAAPHRPRPYATPHFSTTEQTRRERPDRDADPIRCDPGGHHCWSGNSGRSPTRTPLADPSMPSGAGCRQIAGTAAGRSRDATGFPQTPDPMFIGLSHPRSEQCRQPCKQPGLHKSRCPIIARPPTQCLLPLRNMSWMLCLAGLDVSINEYRARFPTGVT